jgi:transcriptional regulator with XRE-family HTH domain
MALDLSQAKLARRAGISKSQVALVELGKRRLGREAALALTRALGLGPEDRDEVLMRAGHAPVGQKTGASLPDLEKAMEALAMDVRLSPEERLYAETMASAFIGWVREAIHDGAIEVPRNRRR